MQSITFPAWSNSKDSSVKWSRLQFGCARIRSAICGSVNLILVVGFIGHAHLRNSFSGASLIQPVSCFLVASAPVRDLLLCAKHLFNAARVAVDGQTSLLVGHRSGAKRCWIEAARSTEPGSLVRRRYSACPVDSCRNVYSVGQPKMKRR